MRTLEIQDDFGKIIISIKKINAVYEIYTSYSKVAETKYYIVKLLMNEEIEFVFENELEAVKTRDKIIKELKAVR